jgi:hypothetical protein
MTGHIYSKKNDISRQNTEQMVKKVWSSKALDLSQMDETSNLTRLREKYEKTKRAKKQLGKDLKGL